MQTREDGREEIQMFLENSKTRKGGESGKEITILKTSSSSISIQELYFIVYFQIKSQDVGCYL